MARTDRTVATIAALLLALVAGSPTVGQEPTPADLAPLELLPTPAQQEGPFYPLEKPADHDADLVEVAGAPAPASGTPLRLDGLLVRTDGTPIEGAIIEIWQTDSQGIYLHPGDPGFADRDPNFQGYGESVSDVSGAWAFRTILPDVYGGRPRHIHAKVRLGDEVVLTTQIYFADPGTSLEGAVARTGSELDALIVELEPSATDGEEGWIASHLLVLP